MIVHFSSNAFPTARRLLWRRGFTVVELMTAMVVTSMLMIALFSLVGQSSTNYRLSHRKVNTLADTRAFLHFLQNDLSSRISDTRFFYRETSAGFVEFAFTRTRSADEDTSKGDLATTIYYVAVTEDDARHESPKIFRRTLSVEETQKLLAQGEAAPFPNYDANADEPLVYNVVSFMIKPSSRNPLGNWQEWQPNSNQSPERLQLTLDLIDDNTAQRFASKDDWVSLSASADPKQREAIRSFTHNISLTP